MIIIKYMSLSLVMLGTPIKGTGMKLILKFLQVAA